MSGDSTFCYEGNENFFIENGILKGYEAPYLSEKYTSYGELIIEHLRSRPEFIGQVDVANGKEATFAEMTDKSVKCAMWLKKQNVMPGDIIGICTHNQTDMYVPCFASLFIGAVFNPWWDTGLTAEVTRHFLNLTKPKVLFVNEASAKTALEVSEEMGLDLKIVVLGKFPGIQSLDDVLSSENTKLVDEFQCTKLKSVDDPAAIIYTSGTTGFPKGALHTHRSLFGNLNLASDLGKRDATSTTIVFSPLSWLSGILLMFRGIVCYEKRIICPEFTEETALQLVEKFKINWMLLAPSTAFRLQKCPSIPNYDLTSLKSVFVGGSVLKKETQKALTDTFPSSTILQAYGATELGGVGVQQPENFRPGSCGRLVKNLTMKVIDPESEKILGPNQTGEACFKSPFMLKCYYRNPEATKATVDSEGWLHTGDLVHYDEEGHIFVTDRIKEMIKYRGHHVSPAMIEQLLQTHPGITEVSVLSIPHDMDGEHPIAFVAKTKNSKVTKEELQKTVADTLPDYMRLRGGVIFLDALPHTPSGKVHRAELRKLARSYAC